MNFPPLKIIIKRPVNKWARLNAYLRLMRLHRPIGIFLLLWPALWALWLAGQGQPKLSVVLIFILGVVLMRSAGCAINDFADRNFDGQVVRTQQRPLATGEIHPREALGIFLILSVTAFILVLFLNWQTVILSIIALGLTLIYPFMKRFTHLPQLFLGAAFGWAIPMAYMALTEQIPIEAWILFAATIVWALIYDTQYAMVDRVDDLRIGVKSTAILFDQWDRAVIAVLQIIFVGLLYWIGQQSERGVWFYSGLLVASGFFLYQQILIRNRDPSACFLAFLNNHYVGMLIFLSLILDYALTNL